MEGGVEDTVFHHMGKRFAGFDFTFESEKNRAHGIGSARIGDDHFRNGLGFGKDFLPAAELVKHT
ncbi:hypothetical protein D3C80_1933310 [compost metagenome]